MTDQQKPDILTEISARLDRTHPSPIIDEWPIAIGGFIVTLVILELFTAIAGVGRDNDIAIYVTCFLGAAVPFAYIWLRKRARDKEFRRLLDESLVAQSRAAQAEARREREADARWAQRRDDILRGKPPGRSA